MRILPVILALLSATGLLGQPLNGLATRWSDSFAEWTVFAAGDSLEGELALRWQMPDDWSDWEYQLGDEHGRIRMKWKDNPNEWEVRGDNEIVSVRTIWTGDNREWRISGDGVRLTLSTRYGYTADEWVVREDQYGFFEMYAAWQGDPREWIIVDELSEEVSLPVKMGLVFAVLFSSTPKQ